MKKLIFLFIASFMLIITPISNANFNCGSCNCECKATSKTFFNVRPPYQSATPEKDSMFYDRMDFREDGRGGAVQIALFGGQSTDSNKLATYFTPFCKRCLVVKECDDRQGVDIMAHHFNILTQKGVDCSICCTTTSCVNEAFESRISFCPSISVVGLGLTYQQNVSKLLFADDEIRYNVWLEISAPITRVETSVCMSEDIISDGDGAYSSTDTDMQFFASMRDAFNQSAWKYGKIRSKSCVKWGIADIEVKLGLHREQGIVAYGGYIGALVPTGNRPCAEYVFEPIVGHNGHWGFTKGGYVGIETWKNEAETKNLRYLNFMQFLYLFSRDEMRSFDLKYKPWSRYMKVYRNKEEAIIAANATDDVTRLMFGTPGINLFTQCVNVSPGLAFSMINAWLFSGLRWSIEAGFNFYARQAECIQICGTFEKDAVLKARCGNGVANRDIEINDDNNECIGAVTRYTSSNYEAAIIEKSDLDLESASHPGLISNTFYAAAGYRWDDKEHPMILSAGLAYEWGQENYILDRWTFWCKYSVSF